MLRLKLPAHDLAATVNACIAGITGNNKLRLSVNNNTQAIVALEAQYRGVAESVGLATIAATQNDDVPILGDLTKSDFKKLYHLYFRGEEKAGRKIYDELMNAAEGGCPYCGGLGSPRNLDHHLPVAHFPQFSILPFNLVPACRDCNMDGKPDNFSTVQSQQIIQPYLDDSRFFDEQWISGRYIPAQGGQPSRIEYFADPPALWSAQDKSRATRHLVEFGVADKYAMRAAEVLGVTLQQVQRLRHSGCTDGFISHIIFDPGELGAPFVNHWLTGMHQALRHSVAFL